MVIIVLLPFSSETLSVASDELNWDISYLTNDLIILNYYFRDPFNTSDIRSFNLLIYNIIIRSC